MKRSFIIFLLSSIFFACGTSKSGKDIAQEICDCSKKANGMPATDPGRKKAQDDCMAKAGEAWSKIRNNAGKSKEYNDVLGKCAEQQIKTSFGQ